MSTHLTPYQSQYVAWLLSRRMNADSADLLTDEELEQRLSRSTFVHGVSVVQWELM